MYNNPFNNIYTPQMNIDRINTQISELEKMRSQYVQQANQPQPTNLTQNFQLAPVNREIIRYANSIEDVQKDVVIGETPYFSKDMSVVWVKNINGDIKIYELNEIIPKDEKDMQIALLQSQIEELRREMKNNDSNVTNVDTTEAKTNTGWDDTTTRTTTKSTQSTGVQRVSTSKKGK